MTMDDKRTARCKFCALVEGDEYITQNEHWRATLYKGDQRYLGRMFVLLRRHGNGMSKLTQEEWNSLHEMVKLLEGTLAKTFGATMFNWSCLVNNAYRDAKPEPHLHWHFRPRYRNAVEFAGFRFEDSEFGEHYDGVDKRRVPDEVLAKIAERIKGNLAE